MFKLDLSGLARNWVWVHFTGLQWGCLLSLCSDFITAWRNVMTRRSPRGAGNQGRGGGGGQLEAAEEGWGWEGSNRGRGGEVQEQIQVFSHYHALPSVKCWHTHIASLRCTQLNVHSSKLSLLPDFTPSPPWPANVSRVSYWMHKATYAIL